MWLLIDDTRDLGCDVIARTPEAAKYLLSNGKWECVCLDHDLGSTESGYDILIWALDNNLLPDKVQLVSSNPIGRERMRVALVLAGYVTVNNVDFERSKNAMD